MNKVKKLKNNNEKIKKKTSSKKKTLIIYFLFLIFLNIFDFFNLLSNDFDFFKKLLSWGIIIYFFYKVSFTKILIGSKEKAYEILYLIAFSFIAIPKALLLHLYNIGEKEAIKNTHIVFEFILVFFKEIVNEFFLLICFSIGIIGIIIISISLISNKSIRKNSLLGSLNLKENYFKKLRLILISVFISLFFGIIIFNIFLEWFALAIDALILVLGLFYYLFKYIKEHTISNFSNFLNDISNTGNSFFQKNIENLSNKKTFSITIGFFIALHLVVDAGVYLVPYLIGTQNSLYFQQLNSLGTEHVSIFNFFDFENSQIARDFEIIRIFEEFENKDFFFLRFQVVFFHLSFLLFYLLLLLAPLYFYYMAVENKKVKINKIINIFFLSFVFLSFFLTILNLSYTENKIFTEPISYNKIESNMLTGVDIHTSAIFSETRVITAEIMSLLPISYLFILIFLIIKYEYYKKFWEKLSLIIIFFFTLHYIFLFSSSILNQELFEIKEDLSIKNLIINQEYSNLFLLLNEPYSQETAFEFDFTEDIKIKGQLVNYNKENFLYTKIKYNTFSETSQLDFNLENKIFQYEQKEDFIKNTKEISYFEKVKFEGLRLGFNLEGNVFYSNFNNNIIEKIKQEHYINEIKITPKKNSINILEKIAQYLRFIFTSIFFLWGVLAFSSIYIRKIILEK